VRVHAAGVDRGVWHLMAGLPYPIRMAEHGVRAPKYPVLGMDLAGVVDAVGTGGRWLGGFDRMLLAPMLSPFVSQDLRSVTASENAADMVVLKDLIEAGQVTPVIERSYPPAEVPDAIRHIEAGKARGKVVITI
jgi:NADPH:quinone reductase-like Zn-dependent oxidoreductase